MLVQSRVCMYIVQSHYNYKSDSSNQLKLHKLEHVWMKWTEGLLAGNNSNIYVLLTRYIYIYTVYIYVCVCDQIWQSVHCSHTM